MAKNTGNGTRRGIIKGRTQFYNPKIGKWIKRCSETGKILETRTEPFKNIRKEKKKGKKETSNIKSSIKKGITSQVKNIRKKNIKCISKKKPKNTDNKKLVSTKKV